MSTTASKLICLALVGGMLQADAFSLNGQRATVASLRDVTATPQVAPLYMSEEAEEAPEEPVAEEGDAAEEEPEEPPEDPEVTALKESIAELESTLADKKSKLQYELEKCEEYSKSGYARKVADMENMKRVRSVSRVSKIERNAFASIVVDLENPE